MSVICVMLDYDMLSVRAAQLYHFMHFAFDLLRSANNAQPNELHVYKLIILSVYKYQCLYPRCL